MSLHLSMRRRVPTILQSEAAECGLACLAMVASHHGFDCDLSALRTRFAVSLRGVTLAQLMQMAAELRLSPRALRLEPAALRQLAVPCILHWNLDHFVVLERATSEAIEIIDPAVGRRRFSMSEASKFFTGVALELTPAQDFERRESKVGLSISDFFNGVRGLRGNLAQLLGLSLLLQIFALLMPFYSQLVIDKAIGAGDLDLLTVLLLGFVVVLLMSLTTGALRSYLVLHFGSRLQFEWATRLFHHLIRLPLGFFEKRHLADILSRFRSLAPIQGLVTTTIVESIIDGLMAMTTLVVMLVYGPVLAAVSVVTIVAYACLRLATYGMQREYALESLVRGAKENSHFLESLRGILAIKTFSREQIRESAWRNHAANAIQAGFKVSLLGSTQQGANQLLFGIENLMVLWLGAQTVIAGGFSLGMLMAFLAYKGQFTSRAAALIDKVADFRLASVHLERLSDIALEAEEGGLSAQTSTLPEVTGRIELRDLCFRHTPTDPYVVKDANVLVNAGECVAIVGPSGAGKTTLLKLMMGLLRAEAGQVVVDGHDIYQGAIAGYRGQIAGVMQEDTLLSGTLAENISFFDPTPNREWIESCARTASIHDDIARMPMGYFTLVGDMGAALSGGQKQRILLARALYMQPRILFLDEATSHVDPETEQAIHQALEKLKCTRVMVAHRRETLSIADRIVHVNEIQQGRRQVRLAANWGAEGKAQTLVQEG